MSVEPLKLQTMGMTDKSKILNRAMDLFNKHIDKAIMTGTDKMILNIRKLEPEFYKPVSDYIKKTDTPIGGKTTNEFGDWRFLMTPLTLSWERRPLPTIKDKKQLEDIIRELSRERTKEFRSLDYMSEEAKEKGKQVFESDIGKKIGEMVGSSEGYDIKHLTAQRDAKAKNVAKLETARREAMKNTELEKFIQYLINNKVIHRLFWKDNPMLKKYNVLDLMATEHGIMDIYEPDTIYYETEFGFNDFELEKPFENLEFGSYVRSVPRKFFAEDDKEFVVTDFEEMLRDREELKPKEVYKNYDIAYGGAFNVAEGDDRKFLLVYLKKAFDIDEDDIKKMIKEEEDEKKGVEEAKKTEKKEKQENIGIPKGKANAIVMTWGELKKKIKVTNPKRHADSQKVKVHLARTKYHYEVVKD